MALPSVVDEASHQAAEHGPELLGLGVEGWVYTSITIFFLLAIFVLKAHKKIAEGLDEQIAAKRKALDEAAEIRAEAAAMLAEAQQRTKDSAAEAGAILEGAKAEARALVEKAEADTTAMVARRKAMAEQKIAAAERAAIESIRNEAAGAATFAARGLIADRHDEAADRRLADEIIGSI